MSKVITIGEALIDFIPAQTGCSLKDVRGFRKAPGGAPANVAACVAKLGGNAKFISKLGRDAFGSFLIDTLREAQVDVDSVHVTDEASTGLAFVSLRDDGERDFAFYRNPSADMLLNQDEIEQEWFESGDILHFCSVDLIEAPVKYAHIRAIEYASGQDVLISFDPNVRLPLWKDHEACRQTIREFLPYAHILKVSDEELPFITGLDNEEEAIRSLFVGNVKMVVYTKGKEGVQVVTPIETVEVKGFRVQAVDTTGAGDSFIGAFLYQLLMRDKRKAHIEQISHEDMRDILLFANACAAIVVGKEGVINILPCQEDVINFINM